MPGKSTIKLDIIIPKDIIDISQIEKEIISEYESNERNIKEEILDELENRIA